MPPKSDGILESSLYVSDVPRSAARWRTLHAQIKPVLWLTSTTEEVLSGVNLRDKRILVTRVSAGLGAETARSLAAHGAQVAGAAREIIISGILSNELPKLRTWVVSRSFWDCDPTACCPLCGDSTGAPGFKCPLIAPVRSP